MYCEVLVTIARERKRKKKKLLFKLTLKVTFHIAESLWVVFGLSTLILTGDLLILFNRNNWSLSVGVFSVSLICESNAAQFLTFVPHEEQTLEEKDSPSSTTTKSSVFSRSANFLNFCPFLVGATNIFSRAYPSTLKIAELCFEARAAHSAIIRSTRLFWFSPSSRSHRRRWHSASFTHFRSSTICTTFDYRHYISQTNNTKICFRNYWIQRQD